MDNENKIRGAVLSRFKSVSEFAQAIGWNYAKTHRIVIGVQKPDTDDIRQMCATLNITDTDKLRPFFLWAEVHNVNAKNGQHKTTKKQK